MDALDDRIIGLLTADARRSFSDLGREVGLSTNAVAARVRRMERTGVILGYTLVTDTPAGPGGLEVFIDVRLDQDTEGDAFLEALRPLPQIADAVHVTGPFDYLLRAVVPDSAALDALLKHLKRSCGVGQSQTRLALRHPRSR
jgi:Lrp/AsnC family leucine-responsive transcriptional regulator